MKLTNFQAQCAYWIQQIREAPGIETAWLPISYVMAHARIESGWDPTIKAFDYATTGSIGLMQCTAANAAQIPTSFPAAHLTLPQTDPYTSLCTGMLVLLEARRYLGIPASAVIPPENYHLVCFAYNEGEGNAARGRTDWTYYYKWIGVQPEYSFLDA